MGKLYLAGSYVSTTDPNTNLGQVAKLFGLQHSGHLQIVYENDAGEFYEIEVQAPLNTALTGDWVFEQKLHGIRPDDQDNVSLNGEAADPNRYSRIELPLKEGQTADQALQPNGRFKTNMGVMLDLNRWRADFARNKMLDATCFKTCKCCKWKIRNLA